MIAFVHIEKCGGTTLIAMLRQAFFLDHFDVIPRDRRGMRFTPEDLEHVRRLRPSVKSLAGHSIRLDARLHEHAPVRYFTLLRDPVKRYLSDFEHLGKRFLLKDHVHEGDDCFERWLDMTERHDFQSKAIASTADANRACELLDSHFAVVGTVEEYADFLLALGEVVTRRFDVRLPPPPDARNVRGNQSDVVAQRARLLDRYGDRVDAANRQDLALYRHVARKATARVGGDQPLAAAPSSATAKPSTSRATLAWIYRNAIYKPYVGRLPFVPHALPAYVDRHDSAPAQRRVA